MQTCRVNRAAIPKLLPNISSGLILTGLCGQDVLCPYVAAVGTSLRWHLPGSPSIPGLRPLFANLPNIRMENLKEQLTDIVFRVVSCRFIHWKFGTAWYTSPTKAAQRPKKGPCAMAKKRDQCSHTCRHTSILGAERRASNCWRRKSHIFHMIR